MKISVDFNKITGIIKPMHAVGQPPYTAPGKHYLHYMTEANIPYGRLHDMGGRFGDNLYVDIPNVFRDWNADETLPENYDFAFTDDLLTEMLKAGIKPFYRLGVTIENYFKTKAYRIFPPADNEKWARICEHIIMHYNEGWANGFHYDIEYWEIWNEPDNDFPGADNQMWTGTKEQYYDLYEVTATHLKKRFGDKIKVGGFASCGFYAREADKDGKGLSHPAESREEYFIEFMHGFLNRIVTRNIPLDFFSWHSYDSVANTVEMEKYIRKVLANYGLSNVPDMLNEWNVCPNNERFSHVGATKVLSMMLAMQKLPVSMLMFYDARMRASSYEGLFNAETRKPTPVYSAFKMFGNLYILGNEAESDIDAENVYAVAATGSSRKSLVIANNNEYDVKIELDISGTDKDNYEILGINDINLYSPTGKKIENGIVSINGMSAVEIRFY